MNADIFRADKASKLAHMRVKARRNRNVHGSPKRLTYDCLSAIVKGDEVVCKEGHQFKATMFLLTVLKGISSSVCQKCKDYNGETVE
jgi:hypothetical protein